MCGYPAKMYLLVDERLLKVDDTAYFNADLCSLVNNGIMYLYTSIGYKLFGQQIEYLNDPGIATNILGLLTYPDDNNKSRRRNQLWYKDTTTDDEAYNIGFVVRRGYIIAKPTIKKMFSFAIPLKHIFGFSWN